MFTFDFFMLIPAVATISYTVTSTRIFREPREWLVWKTYDPARDEKGYLGEWISCPYCFSHWVAILLVILSGVRAISTGWEILDILVTWLALPILANIIIQIFRALGTVANHKAEKGNRNEAMAFGSSGLGSGVSYVGVYPKL